MTAGLLTALLISPAASADDDGAGSDVEIEMSVQLVDGAFTHPVQRLEPALRRQLRNVRNCFNEQAQDTPGLVGDAHIEITFSGTDGTVDRPEVTAATPTSESTIGDDVTDCITDVFTEGRIGRLPPLKSTDSEDDTPVQATILVSYKFQQPDTAESADATSQHDEASPETSDDDRPSIEGAPSIADSDDTADNGESSTRPATVSFDQSLELLSGSIDVDAVRTAVSPLSAAFLGTPSRAQQCYHQILRSKSPESGEGSTTFRFTVVTVEGRGRWGEVDDAEVVDSDVDEKFQRCLSPENPMTRLPAPGPGPDGEPGQAVLELTVDVTVESSSR